MSDWPFMLQVAVMVHGVGTVFVSIGAAATLDLVRTRKTARAHGYCFVFSFLWPIFAVYYVVGWYRSLP